MCFTVTKNTRKYHNTTAKFIKVFTLHMWLDKEKVVNYKLKSVFMDYTYLQGKATDDNVQSVRLFIKTDKVQPTPDKLGSIKSGYYFLTYQSTNDVKYVKEIAKNLREGLMVSEDITILIIAKGLIYIDIVSGEGICEKFKSNLYITTPIFIASNGYKVQSYLDHVLMRIQDEVNKQERS